MQTPDFLLIGGGIFGLPTAIELRQRGYTVQLINPGRIPHPLASSTDISKVVRMEYGADREYADMAEQAIDGWRAWNALFGETLYHEVGFLLLCRQPMATQAQAFERASYACMNDKGYPPQRHNAQTLAQAYPAFQKGYYQDGFYNPTAGFVEAAYTLKKLKAYAQQLGIEIVEGQTAETLEKENGKVTALRTREGQTFQAGHYIVCAGPNTPYLLPELQPMMRISGHPVFHLQAKESTLFQYPQFTVFAADISNSGWYGFPIHPKEGVIKIARHGTGLTLHPEKDPRVVTAEDEAELRSFLAAALPALTDAPIVYTRRCLYTDTLDGHFWIDRHPRWTNLSVATGGSGHGMKMGPVLGQIIADKVEQGQHRWSDRYDWRSFEGEVIYQEEARSKA
ncbi:MAG: FAD-dependent oxidoreductase [Bacteroidota bacterium]